MPKKRKKHPRVQPRKSSKVGAITLIDGGPQVKDGKKVRLTHAVISADEENREAFRKAIAEGKMPEGIEYVEKIDYDGIPMGITELGLKKSGFDCGLPKLGAECYGGVPPYINCWAPAEAREVRTGNSGVKAVLPHFAAGCFDLYNGFKNTGMLDKAAIVKEWFLEHFPFEFKQLEGIKEAA